MEIPPELRGLIASEAAGRVDAILASLGSSIRPGGADVRWGVEAAGAVAGLAAQLDDPALALHGEQIVIDVAGLNADLVALPAVIDRLRGLRSLLDEFTPFAGSAPVALDMIATLAASEIQRIAVQRGVRVAVDLICPERVCVPSREAGVLIDVLGQVVRDGATNGTKAGGAMRLVFAIDDDGLVVVVSDRGDAGRGQLPSAERNPARGMALGIAQGRLVSLGGELSLASGAWGGTSVTVRLPAAHSTSEEVSSALPDEIS